MFNLPEKSAGISLLEVCLCLILLVILNSIALPQMQNMKLYFDSRGTQKSLQGFLSAARARALHRQQVVTLCPLSDGLKCTPSWSGKLSFFEDKNSNAILDGDESLIADWDAMPPSASLSWTLNRRYIRFRPNGSTTATTGSLRYCLTEKDSPYNFRIVVARTGRSRVDHSSHGCN